MIEWATASDKADKRCSAVRRVVFECCVTRGHTTPLCCVRGGTAVQLMLPTAWRRKSRDIDLYHASDLKCVENRFSIHLDGAQPADFDVTARDFVHESLSLPIREVSIASQNQSLCVQVTIPYLWPQTVSVESECGFMIHALAPPELVAEKLLKFSTHSKHRHNSRKTASRHKHLSDLFLLLTHCQLTWPAVSQSCHRILAQERHYDGQAPALADFLSDVDFTIANYARPKAITETMNPSSNSSIEVTSYLQNAAQACRIWLQQARVAIGKK